MKSTSLSGRLKRFLKRLPRIYRQAETTTQAIVYVNNLTTCKICGCESLPFGRHTLLDRHEVAYFQCQSCGFAQTEEPYWLEEAYSNLMTTSDTGVVQRNFLTSSIAHAIILLKFYPNAQFLDFGGGFGLLTRMMRDRGLDFYWFDKHCDNLFAKGFERKEGHRYELVTAFEMLEHVPAPLDAIEEMLTYGDNLLLSTSVISQPPPTFEEWDYYGCEHGQHVSFFTAEAFKCIAENHGLHYSTNGDAIHLLSKKRISTLTLKLLSRRMISEALVQLLRFKQKNSSLA